MGKLVEIKTKATDLNVKDYIMSLPAEQKRKDAMVILEIMKKATGVKPKIWGTSLIGFGDVVVKSPATGRAVEWFRIGFAPRKANISIYLPGTVKIFSNELKKLGKHKTGMGCLYITKLSDIDLKVFEEIVRKALKEK